MGISPPPHKQPLIYFDERLLVRWRRNAHRLGWAGIVLAVLVLASLLIGTGAVSALRARMVHAGTDNSGTDPLFSSYDDFVRYVAGQRKAPFGGNKIVN